MFAVSKTKVATGLIAAVALSFAGATAAQAVEAPHGMTSQTYDLSPKLRDGSNAAYVKLTWMNGYHGRVEVSWSSSDRTPGATIEVEIDGHDYAQFTGNVKKTDGTIFKSVRVRGCDSKHHCGSSL